MIIICPSCGKNFDVDENSNLSSVKVSDELSHPIKGLLVGSLVSYSKIHLSVLPVPDCIGFLLGI